MIGSIKRTIILGGRGQMARLLIPYLPSPTTLIDINTFEETGASKYLPSDRAVRRITSAELKSASKAKAKLKDDISSLCVLSVPNEVYQQASSAPGSSKLTHLLGVSGRGYKNTLFIHQTSVHTLPSHVLEPISGLVLGMHLLHGPNVSDFEEETAIITVSDNKKVHDRFKHGHELVEYILRKRMGYGHVFQMEPERHDTIMSNIQFLTHSMLLILGDALLSSGYVISPNNFHELPASIYILLGRMSKQQPHVYKGIATGNKSNDLVVDEIRSIAEVKGNTELDWLCDGVRHFGDIRDRIIENTKMSKREQDKICTPMSRVRDGIIQYARTKSGTEEHYPLLIGSYVEKYIAALSSGYDEYFSNIIDGVNEKLSVLDFESLTMKKYDSLR